VTCWGLRPQAPRIGLNGLVLKLPHSRLRSSGGTPMTG